MNRARWAILILAFALFGGIKEAAAGTVRGISFDAKRGGIQISVPGAAQPTLQQIDSPARLLIDIPNASWTGGTRRVNVRDPRIKSVRLGQYSVFPAIVRVVIELKPGQTLNPAIKRGANGLFVALSGGSPVAMRPTVKPVVQASPKPVVKPVVKPIAKPVVKPIAKPVVKPTVKPIAKPVAKPTAKPTVKPAAKPAAKPAKISRKPVLRVPQSTPAPLKPVVAQPTPAVPSLKDDEMPDLPTLPSPTPKTLGNSLPSPEPTLLTKDLINKIEKGDQPTPRPATPAPKPVSETLPASSFQLVWNQLDVSEAYPVVSSDGFTESTTYGILTDFRGVDWHHWITGNFGVRLEGRMSAFKLTDRLTEKMNDRSDVVAQPSLMLRLPLGSLQPEASLGFLYRTTQVKANADLAGDTTVYPTNANMSIMAPTFGAGLRWQVFQPLALYAAGEMTAPFGSTALSYSKQENLSSMMPLSQSRMTLSAILDLQPLQFSVGGYLENINGKANSAIGLPAYKQANNGISVGCGFTY